MFPPAPTTGFPGMPQSGSAMDTAPPSPQSVGAGPTGTPTPMSLSQMAPRAPSAQMPPEILSGILQSSETVAQLLDSWAQALPDLATDFALVKDVLQRAQAKVVAAGANPTSPTSTGSAFPAAFDRGMSGAGTQ